MALGDLSPELPLMDYMEHVIGFILNIAKCGFGQCKLWKQIKGHNTALDAWLWQLRDAIEEAEDSLDELEYYKLKEGFREREEQDEP
ncbi:putative disease resistance protein RGA3 isoform X3 [Panicum miliaceum]|uniref:Disease resistance protein RGA3 isoform X3 n=1 Tax=Panicum miliaceum TaxID=4540 RepID=A0A3L6S178_PANMI|nr:putative disease resistance protein RGA3 isoform X3 [Panicum miliaceum]